MDQHFSVEIVSEKVCNELMSLLGLQQVGLSLFLIAFHSISLNFIPISISYVSKMIPIPPEIRFSEHLRSSIWRYTVSQNAPFHRKVG
jgi:hypothetical protein